MQVTRDRMLIYSQERNLRQRNEGQEPDNVNNSYPRTKTPPLEFQVQYARYTTVLKQASGPRALQVRSLYIIYSSAEASWLISSFSACFVFRNHAATLASQQCLMMPLVIPAMRAKIARRSPTLIRCGASVVLLSFDNQSPR